MFYVNSFDLNHQLNLQLHILKSLDVNILIVIKYTINIIGKIVELAINPIKFQL
jgi:hypothetical protein